MLVGIPEILCDLAVKDFVTVSPIDAGISTDTLVKHEIRDTTIRFIEENHWMTGVMQHIGIQANKFHDWGFDLSSLENIQYAEYEDGQHYNWHIDTFIKGEIIPLEKGSVIAFPSFYPHRVTSVTKGIRRSATLWITGPAFR